MRLYLQALRVDNLQIEDWLDERDLGSIVLLMDPCAVGAKEDCMIDADVNFLESFHQMCCVEGVIRWSFFNKRVIMVHLSYHTTGTTLQTLSNAWLKQAPAAINTILVLWMQALIAQKLYKYLLMVWRTSLKFRAAVASPRAIQLLMIVLEHHCVAVPTLFPDLTSCAEDLSLFCLMNIVSSLSAHFPISFRPLIDDIHYALLQCFPLHFVLKRT